MSKDKLMPELRFPEFVKDEEWKEKKLGDVTENVMYGMNAASVEYDGENKYIRITDIDESTRLFLPNPLTSPDGQLDEKYLVNVGDLLFTRTGASVGKSYLHQSENEKIYFAGFLIRFAIKKQVPYFIYAQTLTEKYQKWVSNTSTRSGQPGINAEEYKSYSIILPSTLEEQQKIASCLSSLDEVITAQSQKLVLLKEHKKGLMQNLFPQEGETVPKHRFPEFKNDVEWVEKKLGDIAEIITGSTPSTNEPAYYGGDKMFVSPADISDKRIVGQTKTTLTDLGFTKTRQIKAGSVLFVCIGSTIGKVAQNKFNCATNQQLNSLVAFNDYSSDFLYSLLDANSSEIASVAGNHAVPIINKSTFSEIKLPFPSSLEEQQKIASCLSSLDELITAQAEKIEQLKLHKQGLMQGLFPKIGK
ncbi:restriction endonuclease subunit S [Arcicella aquatica]|uniref:Restriction endonuclease subunit S n=1 Tax=Arcicella aquatica TaxID=217141 RepID=A0ABU5QJQ6_9BACT|nr:restriction endonuclease subunit S [Arcicella aquatica]MEA5257297.1 restriction endonuclease subunit S [Arcicella aquatica]